MIDEITGDTHVNVTRRRYFGYGGFAMGATLCFFALAAHNEPTTARAGEASSVAQPASPGIPPGYREWQLISVAHEEGGLHSFAAILGNRPAIKAYIDQERSFPDGAIIAALHYKHVPSTENNKVFGQEQSFVPGEATNVQFMVKDSKKYAATGGWGFAHFLPDGSAGGEKLMSSCFPCHSQAKSSDLVFTRYLPNQAN
jgi:hypothetical protein